jgi:hypothetical protein
VTGPALESHLERAASHGGDPRWRRCYHAVQQDRQVCYGAAFCFALFVLVRGLMQVRPIGRRLQAARPGSRLMYFYVVVVHGPIIVFLAVSALFWIKELVAVSSDDCKDVKLVRTLRVFGCLSLFVAVMSCVVALQLNTVLRAGAAGRPSEKVHRRGAPPGFIARIPTVPYDPELFGAEDGRPYHGECLVCLGEFGAEDEIKVPYCGHAYHRECLGRWLLKERTCALCRRDVTQAPEAGAGGAVLGADAAALGVGGPEEATPGTASAAHRGVARVQPLMVFGSRL